MDSEDRMSVRRSLISLALALFAAGCLGEGHPLAVQQPLAAPHFLRWAGSTPPQFTAISARAGLVVNGVSLAYQSAGLSLDRYVATFWAVRGEPRSVQINYADSAGATDSPFLRLVVDDPTYVPGQGDLAPGDSVLITVTIDTANIAVSFEPTGLLFGDPSQLQIWYGGAGGDLNGDGVVDSTDVYIESQLLGMRYREGADGEWTDIPATHSLSDRSFTSVLPHFSVYAVSW
jgi:hypothetical protein